MRTAVSRSSCRRNPKATTGAADPDANEIYARAYHFDPLHDRQATFSIEPLDPS